MPAFAVQNSTKKAIRISFQAEAKFTLPLTCLNGATDTHKPSRSGNTAIHQYVHPTRNIAKGSHR